MYVIGAGVFVLGIVTAGIGYAVAITAGCAMVAALTIGAGIGIIAGNIAAYGGAYLVSSMTGANMHDLYGIYSVLGTIGALIGAFGASFLLAPAVSSGAAASGVGTTVGAGVAGEEVGSSVVENTGGNGAQNIPETNVPSGTGHPTNPTGDNPVLDPKSGYIDEVSKKVSKLKDDVVDIYRFFHDNAVELYGNQQVILKATDLVHIIEKDALQFQNEMKNVEEYKELCDEMHMLESKAHEVVSILDSGRNFTAKEFNALVEGIIDEYVKILKNFGNYFHPIEFNPDSL